MSEMMVLGFENEMEADRFGLKLAELQKDMIVQLSDAAEVVRDPGRQAARQARPRPRRCGRHGRRLLGHALRPALLHAVPRHGHRRRPGRALRQAGKTGIDKEVLQQMGDAVPPGKAGWFLIIGR